MTADTVEPLSQETCPEALQLSNARGKAFRQHGSLIPRLKSRRLFLFAKDQNRRDFFV